MNLYVRWHRKKYSEGIILDCVKWCERASKINTIVGNIFVIYNYNIIGVGGSIYKWIQYHYSQIIIYNNYVIICCYSKPNYALAL